MAKRTSKQTAPARRLPAWKLEDAKARFSELVRCAQNHGPQLVTRRGETAVVVIGAEDFDRLVPPLAAKGALVEFLQRTQLGEIDVERAIDRGREPPA